VAADLDDLTGIEQVGMWAGGADGDQLGDTRGALALKLFDQSLSLRSKLAESCCKLRIIRRGHSFPQFTRPNLQVV